MTKSLKILLCLPGLFSDFKIVMKGGRFASRLTTLQHSTSRRYKQKQNIIKQRSSKSNKGTRNAYQTQLQTGVTQGRGCGGARGRRLWGRKAELEMRLTKRRSCGGARDLNEAVTEENKNARWGWGKGRLRWCCWSERQRKIPVSGAAEFELGAKKGMWNRWG